MFVGDKINPEDTWILTLSHLDVTFQTFIVTLYRFIVTLYRKIVSV
jgi:hypothetical protein